MSSRQSCRSRPTFLLAATLSMLGLAPMLRVSRAGAAVAGDGGQLIVTPRVTILEDPHDALPVRLAAQDLQADFAHVFGTEPRNVTRREDAGPVTN